MTVVAQLREHGHQHILEQFNRAQHGRQPGQPVVDARGVVGVHGGDERGRVERHPSRRVRRGRRGRFNGGDQYTQLIVAECRESADAVPADHGPLQEPQSCDIGVGVHPASVVTDGCDGAVAALPRAQGVDTQPGQFGNRADRVVRRRVAWFPHRPATAGHNHDRLLDMRWGAGSRSAAYRSRRSSRLR